MDFNKIASLIKTDHNVSFRGAELLVTLAPLKEYCRYLLAAEKAGVETGEADDIIEAIQFAFVSAETAFITMAIAASEVFGEDFVKSYLEGKADLAGLSAELRGKEPTHQHGTLQ